jgi:hypothetical protein
MRFIIQWGLLKSDRLEQWLPWESYAHRVATIKDLQAVGFLVLEGGLVRISEMFYVVRQVGRRSRPEIFPVPPTTFIDNKLYQMGGSVASFIKDMGLEDADYLIRRKVDYYVRNENELPKVVVEMIGFSKTYTRSI